jgi:hypothetical protein
MRLPYHRRRTFVLLPHPWYALRCETLQSVAQEKKGVTMNKIRRIALAVALTSAVIGIAAAATPALAGDAGFHGPSLGQRDPSERPAKALPL